MKRLPTILILIVIFYIADSFVIMPALKKHSETYLDESLALAAATYATSRVINAGVSTLQETTFPISPWGIGMEVTPGQMLDPINDATERLSDLCARSIGLLTTQRILILAINEYTVIPLYICLGLFVVTCFFTRTEPISRAAFSLVLLLALLRISTPIMCTVGNFANERYFKLAISESISGLSGAIEIATRDQEFETSATDVNLDTSKELGMMETVQIFFVELRNTAQRYFAIIKHRSIAAKDALQYLGKNLPDIIDDLTTLFAAILSKIIVQVFIIPLATLAMIRWVFREITGNNLQQFRDQAKLCIMGSKRSKST